jgi:hypothetical protein
LTDLNTEGHLHDGGESVSFYLNGNETCKSNATYGGEGNKLEGKDILSEMSRCQEPLKIKKGDKASLIARYDLEKHPQ